MMRQKNVSHHNYYLKSPLTPFSSHDEQQTPHAHWSATTFQFYCYVCPSTLWWWPCWQWRTLKSQHCQTSRQADGHLQHHRDFSSASVYIFLSLSCDAPDSYYHERSSCTYSTPCLCEEASSCIDLTYICNPTKPQSKTRTSLSSHRHLKYPPPLPQNHASDLSASMKRPR